MGATAFRIQCQKFRNLFEALDRKLSDLDFIGYRKHADKIEKLFTELGYVVRPPSLVVHYWSRQIHIDEVNGRVTDA